MAQAADGRTITIAGAVACCQRPETAKGFVFISLEDGTGTAIAVVLPDLFEQARLTITQGSFLRITGPVQTAAASPSFVPPGSNDSPASWEPARRLTISGNHM